MSEAALQTDVEGAVATLMRDGVTGLKGAFPRDWVEQMREDMMTAFWAAIQRPGGAVGRGPRRWYVEVHPQEIQGFVDLVTHPWIAGMCEAVLGPRYEIVEIGFDGIWIHHVGTEQQRFIDVFGTHVVPQLRQIG